MPAIKSTKTFKLNNGKTIPAIGLGTWQASEEGAAYNAVVTALKAGYRHIDTAAAYHNEAEVGKAIRDSGVPREEIFLTTKLWCTSHKDPAKGLEASLEKLGLDYVDLYLMHWPAPLNPDGNHPNLPTLPSGKRDVLLDWDYIKTYKLLQKLPETGKTKSIGVSNFSVKRLEALLADPEVTVKPVANQIEAHPYLTQPKLVEFCKKNEILIEAYSPLGSSGAPLFKDETVVEIAKKYNVEPAQILISWALWRGTVVLPKSVSASRIESNFEVVELSDEDGETLNKLAETKGKRFISPDFSPLVIFNDDE